MLRSLFFFVFNSFFIQNLVYFSTTKVFQCGNTITTSAFPALAFLPVDQVTDGFEVLTEDWTILQEFLSYFKLTYIGGRAIYRGRGSIKRRVDPILNIKIWNVFDRVAEEHARTNNAIEGFKSAIKKNSPVNIQRFGT